MSRIKGTDSDKKLAALMYRNRQHQVAIAEFFKVSQSTISAWIREGELLIKQEEVIQNQMQTTQNLETEYLKNKLRIIEENYQFQIRSLIEMARAMSMSRDEFLQRKNTIDIDYQNQIENFIEYK